MPLVVPTVARFAVNQTLEGRNVVNVLDYSIDTTGSTMSRDDAVAGQAASIIDQWVQQLLPWQVDDLALNSVSFVDLNSSSGVTGSVVVTGTNTLPKSSTRTGAPLPANTSVLVTKQTTSARGRRSGRVYWAGIDEINTELSNGNNVDPATRTSYQASWTAFLNNTNELDTLGTAFSSNMVVVSVTARDTSGNPTQGVGTEVSALAVQGLLATQRRRLRG